MRVSSRSPTTVATNNSPTSSGKKAEIVPFVTKVTDLVMNLITLQEQLEKTRDPRLPSACTSLGQLSEDVATLAEKSLESTIPVNELSHYHQFKYSPKFGDDPSSRTVGVKARDIITNANAFVGTLQGVPSCQNKEIQATIQKTKASCQTLLNSKH